MLAVYLASVAPSFAADQPNTEPQAEASQQSEPSSEKHARPSELEEVVVTGTRLGTVGESIQDVHVYDQPRIEYSGQSTVSDFLATLPEVSLNSVESTYNGTTVYLRGAAPGSALILINGRRTQPVSGGSAPFGFFDLNTIPLDMVERIEVLPGGSSAIYGGEALAGVVNIVLRSDFTGAVVGGGYKWAKDTHEWDFSAGGGWKGDDFNVSVIATYTYRTPMLGSDRAITASADYTAYGGPNLGSPLWGAPANVYSVSGNLPGLNSSFAAVPAGSSGVGLKPSDFAGTAGTLNTGSLTAYQSAVPELHRGGVFVNADYRIGPTVDLFAEVLASIYQLNSADTPPFLEFASVPASNPFNPFSTTVQVAGVVQGAESLAITTYREDFLRPVIGARGSFGTWRWELSALDSRDEGNWLHYGRPNTASLNAALASSNPNTALNPFVDGPMANPQLLASIYSDTNSTPYKSDDRILNGFLRGPLLQLPGGALDSVFGSEYERSTLSRGFDAKRTVGALFTELRLPFLSANTREGEKFQMLALQGAARYDHYSDFGSKTTWQLGIEFRPIESLLLRGTEATAFKPPTLYELTLPPMIYPVPVTDPQHNNQTVVVNGIFGGNPELYPTTSRTSTLGIVWSPREIEGLNASMTWWRLQIDDGINLPGGQYLVDNSSYYPGRVTRAPDGQITSVNYSYINFGTMREQGIDGKIDWRFRTWVGDVTPAIAATYMSEFTGSSTLGAPAVDRLSHANYDAIFAPQWKGIASITWSPRSAVNIWVDGRYIGRYWDYTPTRTIGNIWYLDASVEVGLEQALGRAQGSLGGMKLLLSGTNLADRLPVYSTYFRGYDVFNYDLVGRTIYARLQLRW